MDDASRVARLLRAGRAGAFASTCRACLATAPDVRSIIELGLAEQLLECTGVHVSRGDDGDTAAAATPRGLCSDCHFDLSRAFDFRERCQRADAALRDFLSGEGDIAESVKEEPGSDEDVDDSRSMDAEGEDDDDDGAERGDCDAQYFLCEVCDARFKYKRNWRRHRLRHEDSAQFECADCGKAFSGADLLSEHRRAVHHHDGAYYECPVCSVRIKHRKNWARHARRHEVESDGGGGGGGDERRHACDECERSYAHESDLREHARVVHSADAEPHACVACSARFRYKKNLRRHERARHGMHGLVVEPLDADASCEWHACDLCNARYRIRKNLETHLENYHGGATRPSGGDPAS